MDATWRPGRSLAFLLFSCRDVERDLAMAEIRRTRRQPDRVLLTLRCKERILISFGKSFEADFPAVYR
jgi:hypothetical protein